MGSLLQESFPLGSLEPDDCPVVGQEYRSFYEHSVGCEQLEQLFERSVAHFFFQVQLPVAHTAGVEPFLYGFPAHFNPFPEFFSSRVVRLYVAHRDFHAVAFQEILCLAAGTAFGVSNQSVAFHFRVGL